MLKQLWVTNVAPQLMIINQLYRGQQSHKCYCRSPLFYFGLSKQSERAKLLPLFTVLLFLEPLLWPHTTFIHNVSVGITCNNTIDWNVSRTDNVPADIVTGGVTTGSFVTCWTWQICWKGIRDLTTTNSPARSFWPQGINQTAFAKAVLRFETLYLFIAGLLVGTLVS
jgi:hypothetical protein